MPNGYTHNIPDGISLRQYMLQCVRAMGVCVHLRDDASAPIPKDVELDRYHEREIEKAKEEWARVNAMTMAEVEALCSEDNRRLLAEWEASSAKNDRTRAAYQRMLEKVNAWPPPTPEHESFKKFMAEQITQSIEFDCPERERPVPLTPGEWLRLTRDYAEYSVSYHTKKWAEVQAKTAEANAWLKAFWDSLPLEERPAPVHITGFGAF